MSDQLTREVDELLNEVKKPQRERKPSNAGLWFVLIFVNVVGIVLDIISAVTVYSLTGGLWLYSILTFLAGFVPFVMWESAFTRAHASALQRKVSIGGVVFAVLSILTIGTLSGISNAQQLTSTSWAETTVLITLVFLAVIHGVLAGVYFYSDEGIRAVQSAAQNMAYYERRDKNLDRAEYLLERAARIRNKRKALTKKYQSPQALQYLMSMLDADGDGIPDFLEGRPNLPVNAQTFARDEDDIPNSRKPLDRN